MGAVTSLPLGEGPGPLYRGLALGRVTESLFAFRPPKADSFSVTGGGIDAKSLVEPNSFLTPHPNCTA